MLSALDFASYKGSLMKTIIRLFSILLFVFFSSSTLSGWEDIDDGDARGDFVTDTTFHLLYGGSGNVVLGDFNATGNSILYVDDGSSPNLISSHTSFKSVDADFNSSTYSLNDPEKLNSSSATLHLPPYVQGKDIVWAGLFWQGHIYRPDGTYSDTQVDTDAANWNKVTIKDPLGTMHAITAPLTGNDTIHKTFHHAIHSKSNNSGYRYHYGAYYDITNIVKNSYSSTNNTFTVGNIKTTAGQDTGGYVYITQAPEYSGNFRFGLYGGWSLIVVYDVDSSTAFTNNVPAKNVSFFDGFDLYLTWGNGTVPFETTIDINGFYTPKSGDINSQLLLFAGAGDKGIEDDTLQLQDKKNVGSYLDLSNAPNEAGKQFNHTYTYFGSHITPTDSNKQGMDLDIFDVSDKMDNAQTETKIKFGVVKSDNHCDQLFPQVIGFSTQLYEPRFCYDYAYRQQNISFTEENDGSQNPKIVGDVLTGEPVTVKVFLRNLVDSDLAIEDMNISILDINTTQAIYERETTKLAKTGDLTPQSISDSLLTVSDGYIKGIPVGGLSSNDYFYVYYDLDPKLSSLDMPLKVQATYNLRVNSTTTIPYTLNLGANVPMCSSTNFKYTPQKGLFNIVNNHYYPYSDGNNYNNLPTVVTQRADNYTALAYDANDTTLNTLDLDANVTIAVEMIDASAFHDTFASCKEASSSISERIWITFANSSTTPFTANEIINNIITDDGTGTDPDAAKKFYQTARENAAFRISWNTDNNDSQIRTIEDAPGLYHLENFSDYATDDCVAPVTTDAETSPGHYVTKTYTQVPQACFNAGQATASSMNSKELAACMECIYGKNLHYVCSRDNFSIRPEAFLIQIDDQNQTNPTQQTDITTLSHSGSVGATPPSEINLAADYNYNIEINATNHYTNDASYGYTKTMNITNEDTALYIWEPRSSIVSGACNDENNKSITMRFVNGFVDKNTSVNQVGEYRLSLKDTTWTTVDSNPLFMTHHDDANSNFLPSSYPDCVLNSNISPTVGNGLNGCEITSSHLDINNSFQYNDYNITFHPYKYSVTNNVTLRTGNVTPPATFKPFVYMANVSTDENMSVHLNTTVSAIGKNSTTPLSNYVTGCFAKPMNFEIGKTATSNTALRYSYRVHNKDINGTTVSANDINQTIVAGNTAQNPTFATTSAFFHKNMNGTTQIVTNLNFDRDVNVTANPEDINFTTITVDDNASLFNADLTNNKYAEGNFSVNQRVLYYYGRTIAPKITVICNANTCRTGISATNNNNIKELISYVIFCQGGSCNSSILPTGAQQVADARWFENRNHDRIDGGWLANGTDGTIGPISEVTATGNVNEVAGTRNITANKYETEAVIEYSGPLPYDAIMQMQSSPWLIQNETDANATTNTFIIQFVGDGGWSGKYEDNTTTKTNFSKQTNRRIMW